MKPSLFGLGSLKIRWLLTLAVLLLPSLAHTASDGTVVSEQKISDTTGGFSGVLGSSKSFGISVADLGDLDGVGGSVRALAVGSPRSDDSRDRGAVWVLFLNADGTVASYQNISETDGGFMGLLDDNDNFGWRLADLGDLDGPGGSARALAVGAIGDDDGGAAHGAVWILFLNTDGTVARYQKISDTEGQFTGILDDEDRFGHALAGLGDLDGAGGSTGALAVAAIGDDDGGANRGAVWILFLNADGTVASHQKISSTQGGFTGILADGDNVGESAADLGDLDGVGGSAKALAVGSAFSDDGGPDRGAVWILFLNADGTVAGQQKVSDTEGGFTGVLDDSDFFGIGLADLGDLDGPGGTPRSLAVGASFDGDGGDKRGAVWVLFLNSDGSVASHQKISDTEGGFSGVLSDTDLFGSSVADLGDLDGAGASAKALAVGAASDDDGGSGRGAVWVLFLKSTALQDTDGDGVPDDEDNCPFTPNTDQMDKDSDGFGDVCDNCPLTSNPDQMDGDEDGRGDACDNCPLTPNADQADGDGDGIGDACDACPIDPENDADGDGYCESVDNCPLIPNNQDDKDQDGVGDACDPDIDGDGIDNDLDNCPYTYNPDQADMDMDGTGDVCDRDADGDGVPDEVDACPGTAKGAVVLPETAGENAGCSIAQLVPCDNEWKNHGAYVSNVARTANDFVQLGLITEAEKDEIVSEAANSSCGHRNR